MPIEEATLEDIKKALAAAGVKTLDDLTGALAEIGRRNALAELIQKREMAQSALRAAAERTEAEIAEMNSQIELLKHQLGQNG